MSTEEVRPRPPEPTGIDLPAPSSAPFTCAFGLTLMAAGMVTQWIVTIIGAMVMLVGAIGWFREVHPDNREEVVRLAPLPQPIAPRAVQVRRLLKDDQHRKRIPAEIHPYSAGVWGGIVGGAVMAIVASVGGLIESGSFWYASNLLAATILERYAEMSTAELSAFHGLGLIVSIIIQGVLSIFVGLIYGVTIPMIPRFHLLFAAFFVPLVWSGLTWASLSVVNPALQDRIDWLWYIGAQVTFGLVAGWWIVRTEKVGTMQNWTYLERIGVESPGIRSQGGEEE